MRNCLESTIWVDYRIKLELLGSCVGYLVQPAAPEHTWFWSKIRLLRALSCWILKVPLEGGSAASLPFPVFTCFRCENIFPALHWNLRVSLAGVWGYVGVHGRGGGWVGRCVHCGWVDTQKHSGSLCKRRWRDEVGALWHHRFVTLSQAAERKPWDFICFPCTGCYQSGRV